MADIKISYTILACNEYKELDTLLRLLMHYKRPIDEVHVVLDKGNTDSKVIDTLANIQIITKEKENNDNLYIWEHPLNKNFAAQKNFAASKCNGDFIFNIDADEIIDNWLIESLPSIIINNPTVDVYHVPRINIVNGLTEEHVTRWGWRVNEQGWINFPDYQMRLYRNTPEIKWVRPVHEVLEGHKIQAFFPILQEFCILHVKEIDRQEKQNSFYETIK